MNDYKEDDVIPFEFDEDFDITILNGNCLDDLQKEKQQLILRYLMNTISLSSIGLKKYWKLVVGLR